MQTEELASVQRPTFWAITDDLEAYQESLILVDAQLATPLPDQDRALLIADRAEINDNIARLSAELLTKTDSLAGVIRRMDSDETVLKAEEERLRTKRHAIVAARDTLKAYAVKTMVEHDIKVLKTPLNTIKVQANGGVQPLVVNDGELSPEYKTATVKLPLNEWQDLMVQFPEARLIGAEPNGPKIREALAAEDSPARQALAKAAKLEPRGVHLRLS